MPHQSTEMPIKVCCSQSEEVCPLPRGESTKVHMTSGHVSRLAAVK